MISKEGAGFDVAGSVRKECVCMVFNMRKRTWRVWKIDAHRNMQDGWTPLLYASKKGRRRVVKMLLSRGANVHAVDRVRVDTSTVTVACHPSNECGFGSVLRKNACPRNSFMDVLCMLFVAGRIWCAAFGLRLRSSKSSAHASWKGRRYGWKN